MQHVLCPRSGCARLCFLLVAVYGLWFAVPGIGQAQSGVTLTVQLRDTAEQPLGGSTVRLLDAATREQLAEQTTTDRGLAVFPALRPDSVRVTVAGVLPDGTPLGLVGSDADGIWVEVPTQPWRMELVANTDGTVFPALSLDGAGAADGDDHSAIRAETFGHTATATPAANLPMPTAAPVHTGLQPGATGTASRGELVTAVGWMAVFCAALGVVFAYGRRP